MHISLHAVFILRGGLYVHPLWQIASVSRGNKSRPYAKTEDNSVVILALCMSVIDNI